MEYTQYGPLKEWSLHQFLGTKTTEANKLLKTDAKTILYKAILSVVVFTNINFFGTFLAILSWNTDNIVYTSQNLKIKGSHLKNTKQKLFENGKKNLGLGQVPWS